MIVNDILSKQDVDDLIEIGLFEVKHFLCDDVPLHQTFPYMHRTYQDSICMKNLINVVVSNYKRFYNREAKVLSCWFNVVREDSNYGWHTHAENTAVIYLKNTSNDGTEFRDKNVPCVENSLVFIDKDVEHKTPNWKGKERITMALGMEEVGILPKPWL